MGIRPQAYELHIRSCYLLSISLQYLKLEEAKELKVPTINTTLMISNVASRLDYDPVSEFTQVSKALIIYTNFHHAHLTRDGLHFHQPQLKSGNH